MIAVEISLLVRRLLEDHGLQSPLALAMMTPPAVLASNLGFGDAPRPVPARSVACAELGSFDARRMAPRAPHTRV